MKHARIINMPENPKLILDEASVVSFNHWIDEKGTTDHPGIWQRQPSKLSYEEAFQLIQSNEPHWVTSFRNESYLIRTGKDYWEFGGCNIASNNYGEVFIWIQVEPALAEEIFKKHGLIVENY